MGISGQEGELSPETKLTSTLILDFLVSGTVRNQYPLFKAPDLVFMMAMQADQDTQLSLQSSVLIYTYMFVCRFKAKTKMGSFIGSIS